MSISSPTAAVAACRWRAATSWTWPDAFGTPLIVYDEDHVRARCREALAVFGDGAVAYAAKAFLCRAMAQLVRDEGLHLDVATGGELHVALAAGFPPERLVLHGNNKSSRRAGATPSTPGWGASWWTASTSWTASTPWPPNVAAARPVLLRVTPGVEAHTHVYLTTGRDDSKFGFTVSSGAAAEAVQRARAADSVELVGIHAHIGSQVFRIDSFQSVRWPRWPPSPIRWTCRSCRWVAVWAWPT